MENMSSIDRIKSDYIDKFDYLKNKTSTLNLMNFSTFEIHISSYKLEQKMEDLENKIKEGKIKDAKIIEQCTEQLNNMKVTIKDIFKKIKEDEQTSNHILYNMELKYDDYSEVPEALDIFKRISSSILKENVEKLIKYEKIFLLYNEFLIDINKQLNIKI